MNIYYGQSLLDIKSIAPPGTIVFEDRFKKFTFMDYEECWKQLFGIHNVICKTRDAIRCAPADSSVIRVGRSVRISDHGEIVKTEMPLAHFHMIEL